MLILVLFFIIFDVFSPIFINQSQFLMKKLTKSSKNVAGKKGWFYSKEILLFCLLKKWYLEGFYPLAEDEKVVIGKIRAGSLQKQSFHHQQMSTDHPNDNWQKNVFFPSFFFQHFWNQRFFLFYETIIKIIYFWSNFLDFMKRDTIISACKL